MNHFSLSNFLDSAISRHETLCSWNYVEAGDDDAHVDVVTVSGVVRVHVFLETSFTAFLRTETHFLKATTPSDFESALVSLS
ncbi:hypothetical protein [Corynebacterium hindlerae]|uniref:hypothetical protein n=1 Tax=Corynebacterium hindlerae TaxID=699041 RepID=UPI001C7140DB|nr:hypothetical protein [Corynebacterium hindlerae]